MSLPSVGKVGGRGGAGSRATTSRYVRTAGVVVFGAQAGLVVDPVRMQEDSSKQCLGPVREQI